MISLEKKTYSNYMTSSLDFPSTADLKGTFLTKKRLNADFTRMHDNRDAHLTHE